MKRRLGAVLVACILSGVGTAAVATPLSQLVIRLQWRVNTDRTTALPAVDMTGGMRTLKVEPVIDALDPANRMSGGRTRIGENNEESNAVLILTDSSLVTFVNKGLLPQLRSSGLPMVSGDAEDVLKIELVEFWATETTRYRASVRVRCTLTDASGKEIWRAVVGGVGDNVGRSLKEENYSESFTSAVIDLAGNLVRQEAFINALKLPSVPRAKTTTTSNAASTEPSGGDAAEQYNLAIKYAEGPEGSRDLAQMLVWLLRSAGQGYAPAQGRLGVVYFRGEGVPRDFEEATKWYRMAADQGDATAQNNLGVAYAGGRGVPQDDVQALKWLELACQRSSGEDLATYVRNRDAVAARMKSGQRAEAQRLVQEWLKAFSQGHK